MEENKQKKNLEDSQLDAVSGGYFQKTKDGLYSVTKEDSGEIFLYENYDDANDADKIFNKSLGKAGDRDRMIRQAVWKNFHENNQTKFSRW